jgi:hypothetical protein
MRRVTVCLTIGYLMSVHVATASAARETSRSGWSPLQVFGENAFGAALAGNARGQAVVAWRAPDGVHVAQAKPGHRFGASQLIGELVAGRPWVAMNSRGEVAVAWSYKTGPHCCYRIRIIMLSATGHVVSRYTVAAAKTTAALQSLTIADDGLTVVTYEATPESALKVSGSPFDATHLIWQAGRFGSHLNRQFDLGVKTTLLSMSSRSGETVGLYLDEGSYTAVTEIRLRLNGRPRVVPFGEVDLPSSPTNFGEDAHGDHILASVHSEARENVIAVTAGRDGKFWSRTVSRRRGEAPKMLVGLEPPALAVSPSGRMLLSWSGASGFGGPQGRQGLWTTIGNVQGAHVQAPHFLALAALQHAVGSTVSTINSRGQGIVLASTEHYGRSENQSRKSLFAYLCLTDGHFDKGTMLVSTHLPLGQPQVTIDEHGRGVVLWGVGAQLVARRFSMRR